MRSLPQRFIVRSVDRIIDGDTFRATLDLGFGICYQLVVRLARIDAPELAEPGGLESRDYLSRHLGGATVMLDVVGRDRYGRWLCHVLADGVDVSDAMMRDGMATAYHLDYEPYHRIMLGV
jgi:micrococcal nuclease